MGRRRPGRGREPLLLCREGVARISAYSLPRVQEHAFSYSIARADLIADQLDRLASQNLHQLAGQFANLDFWIAEAAGALATLDGYSARYRALRDAQVGWVKAHGTKVYGPCPICRGACEFGPATPDPPRRIRSQDIDAARTRVRHAARRYLLRLYRARFVTEGAVRRACDRVGASVETEDFEGEAATMRDDREPRR